jgi:hypothetical protein
MRGFRGSTLIRNKASILLSYRQLTLSLLKTSKPPSIKRPLSKRVSPATQQLGVRLSQLRLKEAAALSLEFSSHHRVGKLTKLALEEGGAKRIAHSSCINNGRYLPSQRLPPCSALTSTSSIEGINISRTRGGVAEKSRQLLGLLVNFQSLITNIHCLINPLMAHVPS